MLNVERRQGIIDFINQNNGATVAELSKEFKVSEATVRRDLDKLTKRGLIERAHGGAAPRHLGRTRGFLEPPVLKRASQQVAEKRRIGEAAARYVEDGDTILISGGSTTAEMVPHLAEHRNLTVITNAVNVVTLLSSYPDISVIVLGGTLRHSALLTLGIFAEEMLRNLMADKLFLGAQALHVDYGFSSDEVTENQIDRALIGAARETNMLIDSTKFGKIATMRLAPVQQVQRIITDTRAPEEDVERLREQGVQVEVV